MYLANTERLPSSMRTGYYSRYACSSQARTSRDATSRKGLRVRRGSQTSGESRWRQNRRRQYGSCQSGQLPMWRVQTTSNSSSSCAPTSSLAWNLQHACWQQAACSPLGQGYHSAPHSLSPSCNEGWTLSCVLFSVLFSIFLSVPFFDLFSTTSRHTNH
jgi:hypothetical protein